MVIKFSNDFKLGVVHPVWDRSGIEVQMILISQRGGRT